MKKIILFAFILQAITAFSQNAEKMNPEGISFIDPELFNNGALLTYQTVAGDIWLGEIDPLTGLFKSENGFDIKLNSNAAPPIQTFNGPEFGYNANDWSVVYTIDVDGVNHIWESKIVDGEVESRQVTFGNINHQTALASKNLSVNSTRIVYAIGGFQGLMAWKDLDNIDEQFIIDSVDRGIRWINESNSLAYIKQSGIQKGEIAIYDTDTKTEKIISSDGRSKTDPYGWFAPEYNDELLVSVLLDSDTKIGIYRVNESGQYEIIREIDIPENSEFFHFGSPEPFTVAGKSYISCVIKEEERAYSNSEVWIFSLADGYNTDHQIKIEDDLGKIIRTDPETFVGKNELFVYYNVINEDGNFDVYCARTGIETLNSRNINYYAIKPSDTDFNIDGKQEPNYIVLDENSEKLNKLLLYFPGTRARPYDYLKFCKTAANIGYHTISLSYENEFSINQNACGQSQDTTCHRRARNEVWFGEDTHDLIDVDQNNSIINRLNKLFEYLIKYHSEEDWEQYYINGSINWEKITVAGHSQGGGHAGFASKNFKVDKVIMIAASDWVGGQTADWIRKPGPTEKEGYYGFIHEDDFPAAAVIMPTWRDYGILNFGIPVNVDNDEPPYGNVHGLLTSLPVPESSLPHNYVIVDIYTPNADNYIDYLYSPVWKYLLEASNGTSVKLESKSSEIEISPNPFYESVTIRFPEFMRGEAKIEIYNSVGVLIEQSEFTIGGGEMVFKPNADVPGVYFYCITHGKEIYEGSFVKLE